MQSVERTESKTFKSVLHSESYDISNNKFVVYYDDSNKMVFVVDNTISASKPNVLLVLNPVGTRKWDDILANDYAVVLETIRPKKDNKYQKLDVEYSGLGVYDNLILAYNSGVDIEANLEQLNSFRANAVHRSATERLSAAKTITDVTNTTIDRTNANISDIRAQLSGLKNRLVQQRKDIGKEPTKKTAAKILRTEALIESLNEKLKRAEKRLVNAKHRLSLAKEDEKQARMLIQLNENKDLVVKNYTDSSIDKDEEVKPLVTENPQIINENIAFKPIDFSVNSVEYNTPDNIVPETTDNDAEFDNADKKQEYDLNDDDTEYVSPSENNTETGVSFEHVDTSGLNIDFLSETQSLHPNTIDTTETIQENSSDVVDDDDTNVPMSQTAFDNINEIQDDALNNDATEYVLPSEQITNTSSADSVEQDTAAQLLENINKQETPIVSMARPITENLRPVVPNTRPVSPLTGESVKQVSESNNQQKLNVKYYFFLILLIGLSILTLWLYQKKTSTMSQSGSEPNIVTLSHTTQNKVNQKVLEPEVVPVTVEQVNNIDTVTVGTEVVNEDNMAAVSEDSEVIDSDQEYVGNDDVSMPENVSSKTNVVEEQPKALPGDSVSQDIEMVPDTVLPDVAPVELPVSANDINDKQDINRPAVVNKPVYDAGGTVDAVTYDENTEYYYDYE